MTEDSTATDEELDEAPDEDQDTPDGTEVDTAENTQQAQQPTVDWEARYKNLQAKFTKETQTRREREDQLLAERAQRGGTASSEDDPLADERAALEAERQRIRAESEWAAVEREYPPEVVEAFREASRNWQLDPSPRGALAGFMQGISKLADAAGGAPPTNDKKALPTRSEATKPRLDTSRSDAPDPDAIDRRIAGAKTDKDVRAGVGALLERAGLMAPKKSTRS